LSRAGSASSRSDGPEPGSSSVSQAHETTGKSGQIEKRFGPSSTSSIRVTRKAPSKSTIDEVDDKRVSASMEAIKPAAASSEAAEVNDLPPSPRLEVDLYVSDEEKPVESEKDDEVYVDISEATRSLKLDD
jgi:hypothetical protein